MAELLSMGVTTPSDQGWVITATQAALDTSEAHTQQLVRCVQNGDTAAFGELYQQYHPLILRFLLRRFGNQTIAEDLTADTFVRALSSIGTYEGRGSFTGWLFAIATNTARSYQHRSRFETALDDQSEADPPGALGNPEQEFDLALLRRRLIGALNQLDDLSRRCLVLRFLAEWSWDDIAAVLERDKSHLSVIQFRALKVLAHVLQHGRPPKIGRRLKKERRGA